MTYDLDAFDLSLFEEIKNMMKGKFPDMIEAYLEDSFLYIDKIKEGFAGGDKNIVAQYAHPLKSSSAGLGVSSVAIIAKDLEYGAKQAIEDNSDITHLQELMEPLQNSLDKAALKLKDFSPNNSI